MQTLMKCRLVCCISSGSSLFAKVPVYGFPIYTRFKEDTSPDATFVWANQVFMSPGYSISRDTLLFIFFFVRVTSTCAMQNSSMRQTKLTLVG